MTPTPAPSPGERPAPRPVAQPGAVLALDSTGDPVSVAFARSGLVLGVLAAGEGERASAALHRLVGRARDAWLAGARPDLVVAVRGPGSFTGLRVGIAAVEGLSLAWGIPAAGVEATACVSLASGLEGRVACVIGGGHGRVAVAVHVVLPGGAARVVTELDVRDASPSGAARLVVDARVDHVALRGCGPLPPPAEGLHHVEVAGPLAGVAAELALAGALGPLVPLYASEPQIRPQGP